jgi:NADH-quinone oxidoreductase subunit J
LVLVVLVAAMKNLDSRGVAAENMISDVGLIKSLGRELYTKFLVPFEVSSILFIAAMVGAVLLGKKEMK